MLHISEVVEDTVRLLRGVVPPHRVAVMKSSVDGSAGQGGQGADHGDDGEGWNDFPPHDLSEIGKLSKLSASAESKPEISSLLNIESILSVI